MGTQRYLSFFTLAMVAFVLSAILTACGGSSSGDGEGENTETNDSYAVFGSVDSSSSGTTEFKSNDVFATYVGDFAFSFSAADDSDDTILITIQSTVGDPLMMRTYDIGEDTTNKVFAGASFIRGGGVVYNSPAGGGLITLDEFTGAGVSGVFNFSASTPTDGTDVDVIGTFDIVFD